MKVSPENLKLAGKVAGIKESTTTAVKKNFWNAVHRLVTQNNKWVLRTNDGAVWLDWCIPIEGEPVAMDVIVLDKAFDTLRHMEGGAFDVSYANRMITLQKDRLHYRMKEENPQQYPEPVLGDEPKTWKMESSPLSRALRFVGSFIDEANPAVNKSCATIYPNGVISTGNPQKAVNVRGLKAIPDGTNPAQPMQEMSFKTRTAKVVAEFLANIGGNVLVTVTSGQNGKYIFKDPDNGHQLIVCAEIGRFNNQEADISSRIREICTIDRKTLLVRAKAFEGILPPGVNRLNLSFRGQESFSSLRVHTPGNLTEEITDDEFPIFRTFPEKPGEATEERTARTGPVDIAVTRDLLAEALEAMEGTNVKFKYCGSATRGRMLIIEDEIPAVEGQVPSGATIEKSIMIPGAQIRSDGTTQDAAPAVAAPTSAQAAAAATTT